MNVHHTETHPVSCPSGWLNAVDCGVSGSEFETRGSIKAGANAITVDDPGDFRVGQEVTISRCHIHHYGMVYNDREPYLGHNQTPLTDEVEIRGLVLDKAWQTFVLHFDRTDPVTFRWMAVDPAHQTLTPTVPVIKREWCWQGENLPIGEGWIPLCDGVEIRFRKRDWLPGQSVSFHARNRLLARIEAIEGNVLHLSACATRDAGDAVVRHVDQAALQCALDQAVAERKGLLIPAGRYRLTTGLWLRNATARIEGVHRDLTVLDISEDHTAAFWIAGGREVTIRSLAMVGHTGFMDLPANTHFPTANGFAYWPTANQQMEIKGCSAVNFVSTEHLLFEDLKVSRMASEAFYSHGSDRYGMPPYIQTPHADMPELEKQYTQSCTFHRCHVVDTAFNAFNNNDHAECTSILHCRVERATNFCENASRFSRIIGNYVLDGCPTSVHGGQISDPRKIGPTQAIIADNVFEAGIFGGGVSVGNNATQVIVANNLFVGYSKESALFLNGGRRIVVTGNHIDLSRLGDNPDHARCGICVEASNVHIADNQIYVRGERSDKVTGIHVAEHAVNVNIHDNLIENCQVGLRSGMRLYVPDPPPGEFVFERTTSEIVQVDGPARFRESALPVLCDHRAPYRGWHLQWLTGQNAGETAIIQAYDPKTRTVTLAQACTIQAGDRFAVHPPQTNWQIHHNTITGCPKPLLLDAVAGRAGICLDNNLVDESSESGETS